MWASVRSAAHTKVGARREVLSDRLGMASDGRVEKQNRQSQLGRSPSPAEEELLIDV